MAYVSSAVAIGSAAISLAGASANSKAAGRAMRAKAKADEAGRAATASSMIASVHSQNAKVEELEKVSEMVAMQGKADAMIRKENYNDVQSMAMVMGAASGRVLGEGSVDAIFTKSKSDFMWDNMWAQNSQDITQAAIEQDKANIYRAGATSLLLGEEQLGVARLGSMAGGENTAGAAQQVFNNSMMNVASSYLSTYGETHIKSLFDIE